MTPAPRWVVWCASGAFLAALPTALWRLALAAGHPLGTPDEWRAFQDIPGAGTGYVLGLSALQLLAAACAFALVVDVRQLMPGRVPGWARRRIPTFVAVCGLVGAAVLGLIVTMSVVAWDRVDPFAGQPYDGWAWLCAACYVCAAFWPPLLAAASVGHLLRERAVTRELRDASVESGEHRRPSTLSS
ncbi:hypothetical protein [Georgenia alba]|uniref:DUF2975 domain-containing protein n=1 Tax=Georgenia alba TaxID=2233858 RepID=A0ABW2Q3G3_9MICO